MKTYQLSLFALLLCFGSSLVAQEVDVVIIEEEEEEESSFQLSGYVDAYYQANFTNSTSEAETPLAFGSSFTGLTNTFGIGNVNLLAEKSLGKVGFVGQIGFGPRAVEGNGDSNGSDFLGDNFATTIQQLYVTYSPSEAVTFTLGNFGTFVGYEVIDASANMNYSMSYLFSNGPFYHTGAKVDFAITEGFGAMVGVFNDTDSKFDAIEGKHVGGQLSAEVGGLGAYFNVLYGKDNYGEDEVPSDDDINELQLDLTATMQISETFMLGLNASNYATYADGEEAGGFFGTALYATLAASEGFDLSLRGEYYTETAAAGPNDNQPSVLALTASGNIKIGDLRIIPELRLDSGNNGFGPGYFGGASTEDDDSAFAFILAGVYAF